MKWKLLDLTLVEGLSWFQFFSADLYTVHATYAYIGLLSFWSLLWPFWCQTQVMCLFFLPVKQISQVLVHISCTFNLQMPTRNSWHQRSLPLALTFPRETLGESGPICCLQAWGLRVVWGWNLSGRNWMQYTTSLHKGRDGWRAIGLAKSQEWLKGTWQHLSSEASTCEGMHSISI